MKDYLRNIRFAHAYGILTLTLIIVPVLVTFFYPYSRTLFEVLVLAGVVLAGLQVVLYMAVWYTTSKLAGELKKESRTFKRYTALSFILVIIQQLIVAVFIH